MNRTAHRWCVIVNGKSAMDESLRDAVTAARARGVAIAVRVTWEPGDARRFVAEALLGEATTLIAVGGDGTVGEVAGALADAGKTARKVSLGIVPLGTANDFATAAGIPQMPSEAFDLIAAVEPRPIDLLRITTAEETRWCANMLSGGFGPQVTGETSDGLKRVLGSFAYAITAMAKIGRIENIELTARGDDFKWTGKAIAIGIGNGQLSGGGHAFCRDARIDDGVLDLTLVPELGESLGETLDTWLLRGGAAALEQAALRLQFDSLEIEAPEPLTMHVDGEPMVSRRFRIDCCARRVRMHLAPDSPLLSHGQPGAKRIAAFPSAASSQQLPHATQPDQDVRG